MATADRVYDVTHGSKQQKGDFGYHTHAAHKTTTSEHLIPPEQVGKYV
jgi:hypothetical protein